MSRPMCVSQVPIFAELNNEQLKEVFNTVNHQKFKAGDYLYMAEDMKDTLYVVHSGEVRVYRLNDEGDEQLLRILRNGDFTGEYALFGSTGRYANYAEVTKDASVCTIQKEDIQDLINSYPKIGLKIIESFAERLNASEAQTTGAAILSARDRLIDYIDKEKNNDIIELSMTKKNLASLLSMQPETLNRTFSKLESEGVLEKVTHKKYRVL